MTSLESLSSRLRQSGFRMTKVRLSILRFLIDQHCALSAQDILQMLQKEGLQPDASTIYRELQFLKDQEIVHEVVFRDGVMRYEFKEGPHHHHLVCNSCDTVEPIKMERHLESVETSIQQKKNFQVLSHSLEFYGLCESCHEK